MADPVSESFPLWTAVQIFVYRCGRICPIGNRSDNLPQFFGPNVPRHIDSLTGCFPIFTCDHISQGIQLYKIPKNRRIGTGAKGHKDPVYGKLPAGFQTNPLHQLLSQDGISLFLQKKDHIILLLQLQNGTFRASEGLSSMDEIYGLAQLG